MSPPAPSDETTLPSKGCQLWAAVAGEGGRIAREAARHRLRDARIALGELSHPLHPCTTSEKTALKIAPNGRFWRRCAPPANCRTMLAELHFNGKDGIADDARRRSRRHRHHEASLPAAEHEGSRIARCRRLARRAALRVSCTRSAAVLAAETGLFGAESGCSQCMLLMGLDGHHRAGSAGRNTL